MIDVIVVGSGATGTMAAQTIVEKGLKVVMLDGGQRDEHYEPLVPDRDFVDIRRSDPAQHRIFLGDRFEGLPDLDVGTGAQLTPPRRFIIAQVERFLPVLSPGFSAMESLAMGGLGAGWGLGCCVFSPAELAQAGLHAEPMERAYQTVADRIGICAAQDDARPYTAAGVTGAQPPPPLDATAAVLYSNYQRKRGALQRRGFHLGRPALALLTQPKDGRSATRLHDMDFYSDRERAAWRPWIAIERLRGKANFEYRGDLLVTGFTEEGETVRVDALDMRTLEHRTFSCRRLVLAAGTLGTACIVLRSSSSQASRLPLLCNEYSYVPCIIPSRVGKSMPQSASSFAQLALFYDREREGHGIAMGSLYSYRSLMLYRLLAQTPLAFHEGRELMRNLVSGLLILGIHHPERALNGKSIGLVPDASSPTLDRLAIDYALDAVQAQHIKRCEDRFARTMFALGAWPIKRVHPPAGSSIHYAGTLPFDPGEKPFTLARDGRLHQTANVYVADGSGFTYLPAKGLTFSLMANAHVVAGHVAQLPART